MRIAILGFGREGQSLRRFLRKSRSFRGDTITLRDQKLSKNYLKGLSRFDIVFRSPGVPYTLPELIRARKAGVKISSATKIFFSLVDPKKIIGVTGTKGKGTTCTLIYQILKNAGKKVVLAGNIGEPMLDALPQAKRADHVILELSSFQLQDLTVSPHIAVVLDVFPDHLDAHKNLKEYYEAKASIGRHQKKDDVIFYFANNPLTAKIARQSPGRKIAVHPRKNTLRKNYEMAAAIARHLGCPKTVITKTIKSFRGLEHRLETVRTIKHHTNILENVGMMFVNDSAATNPEATAAALREFREPTILIAGGKNKGFDYTSLAEAIRNARNLQMVILFGENKGEIRDKISKAFHGWKERFAAPFVVLKDDLQSSVTLAYQFANSLVMSHQLASPSRERSGSSVIVLFSPASASFDQFKNYADRGEKFKKAVKSLR